MILLLLACTAGAPQPEQAPASPPTPKVSEPWASDADLSDALHKVPRLVGLAARSEADACAAVAHVLSVAPRLDDHLEARLTEDPAALDEALPELARRLPGLKVQRGAEGVQVGPDWVELGRAAQDPAASAALVSAGVWITERPVWARPLSDASACADHRAARHWLDRLAPTLERGPSCLREVLAPALRAALEAFVSHGCFCAEEPVAREDAATTVRELRQLTALDGPALADQLERTLASATFHCGGR